MHFFNSEVIFDLGLILVNFLMGFVSMWGVYIYKDYSESDEVIMLAYSLNFILLYYDNPILSLMTIKFYTLLVLLFSLFLCVFGIKTKILQYFMFYISKSLTGIFFFTFFLVLLGLFFKDKFVIECILSIQTTLPEVCAIMVVSLCSMRTVNTIQILNVQEFFINCYKAIRSLNKTNLPMIIQIILFFFFFNIFFKNVNKIHIMYIVFLGVIFILHEYLYIITKTINI